MFIQSLRKAGREFEGRIRDQTGKMAECAVWLRLIAGMRAWKSTAAFLSVPLLLLLSAGSAAAAGGFYFPASDRLLLPDSFGAESKLALFIDEQDHLYVLNTSTDKMYIYGWRNQRRVLLYEWPLRLPPGGLTGNIDFWVSAGVIYIKPPQEHRVWLYNLQGGLIQKLPLKVPGKSFLLYTDIAVDQRRYIYLLESGSLRIDVFDAEGKYCGVFTKSGRREHQLPGLLERFFIDNQGSIYCLIKLAGINKSQIVKYSYQGRKLAVFPALPQYLYTDIYVDQYQNVFAIAPAESLADKFDMQGRIICRFQTTCSACLAVDGAGQVYLDSGDCFIIRMNPTTVIQLIERGNAALLDESWDVAERFFLRAQILDNQLDYIHSALGEVYFRQHRWPEAMAKFKYLRDNWRYSEALTQFRNSLLLNYWPLVVLILSVAGFGMAGLIRYMRRRACYKESEELSGWRRLSFISVIWNPSATLQTASRSMSPVMAVTIIIIFAVTHYCSKLYSNPIFTGERQILSWVIFGRSLWLAASLTLIWSLTVYKVGELFQGMAKYSHILSGTAICLTPMILGEPLLALLSHLLTFDEYWVYQWLNYLLFGWTAILFFNKIRLTEDFTWSKTLGVGLVNCAVTALFIIFLGFLIGINQQLFSFLADIYKEIYNRMTI